MRRKKKEKSNFWMGVWTTLLILNVAFLATFGMIYLWEENEQISHSSEIKNITYYQNLSVEEIQKIDKIMNQINPAFMYNQKKIIFTKHTPEVCENKCGGANVGKGREIYIKYVGNEERLKERITHELIHTYLIGEKKNDWEHPLHKIVFELASQQVAFK